MSHKKIQFATWKNTADETWTFGSAFRINKGARNQVDYIMGLPLSTATSGRPWSLFSRVLQARLISDPTRAQGRAQSTELQQLWNCNFNRHSSERSLRFSWTSRRRMWHRGIGLRTRALVQQSKLPWVCWKESATMRVNTELRDMIDERAIEVVPTGLTLHQGAEFAVDIIMRCVWTAAGMATPSAVSTNWVVLQGVPAHVAAVVALDVFG